MGGFYSPYSTPTGPIQGQDPLAPFDWLGRKIVPYSPEEAAIVRSTGQLPSGGLASAIASPDYDSKAKEVTAFLDEQRRMAEPLTVKGGQAGPPQPFGDFLKEPGTQTYTDANGGYISVDRSRGLRGEDWLRSQSNLQAAALDPSGVAADPFAGRNHDEGYLFSGNNTQAALEGTAQARQFYEQATHGPEFLAERRELELAKAEREARDPYGIEAYEAKERIRKGTPSIRDSIAQQNQAQQQRDAAKIAEIEAVGAKAGKTPEEIQAAVEKYIRSESIKRAFIAGKYGDASKMLDPFGG